MEQENFINEILNSTNGMTKIVPNDLLFSKIENAIKNQNNVPTKWIWVAAASFAILFSLNSILVFSKKDSKNPTETIATSIYKSNQLY
jgi:hypothetical protein